MFMIDILTLVDTICKKYDIDKQKDSPAMIPSLVYTLPSNLASKPLFRNKRTCYAAPGAPQQPRHFGKSPRYPDFDICNNFGGAGTFVPVVK
ncbi:hypothetical protein ACH5RR_024863 [Cinchona calisaya]|uniref:Uncharacterized protein n=1 Tax=Cinchona calisaya TaxID=153742 RepID=A0ABD2YYS8_9GENT